MGRKISSVKVHGVDLNPGFPEDSRKVSCHVAGVRGGERWEELWPSPRDTGPLGRTGTPQCSDTRIPSTVALIWPLSPLH